MSKFKCCYQSSSSTSVENVFGRTLFNNRDEALRKFREKLSRDYVGSSAIDECMESLESRGYYMIGYGPHEVSIVEVAD